MTDDAKTGAPRRAAPDGEGDGDGGTGATSPRVRAARRAVGVAFAVHGAVSGSYATRIPWIQERLDLGPGLLGLALVCATVGTALAMPFAAILAHRIGDRRALAWLGVLCCAALVLPPLAPSLPLLCLALGVLGAGLGMFDVAMNEHGVEVERRLGRSVMSSLHGMWSVGGLIGGAFGALAAHSALDARIHLALAAPVLALLLALVSRWTLDGRPAAAGSGQAPPRFTLPSRGVLTIGLVGLCAVFAEGASMDWSGIYLRDVTGSAPGLAAGAYTAFACTMAASRLVGDALVRRFGPVAVVRGGGVVALAGGALVALARTPAPAVAGFALIGLGIAIVVPLCFAAAGRVRGVAPGQSIAGVATLAYAAGLAAPAAVGAIAEVTSLSASFAMVTVLLLGLVLGAGVLRPRAPDSPGPKAGRDGESRGT